MHAEAKWRTSLEGKEADDEHTCLRHPWTAAVYTCDRVATALLACRPALEAFHMHIVATLLAEGDFVLWPLGIRLCCNAIISIWRSATAQTVTNKSPKMHLLPKTQDTMQSDWLNSIHCMSKAHDTRAFVGCGTPCITVLKCTAGVHSRTTQNVHFGDFQKFLATPAITLYGCIKVCRTHDMYKAQCAGA